jgi:quercetin dioxygenase-like cupin family protein
VISGTFTYTPEGGAEHKLGPGSYFMVPGKTKHASVCEGASGCVLFEEMSGKFDLIPVAEPAAKKEAAKEAPKEAPKK